MLLFFSMMAVFFRDDFHKLYFMGNFPLIGGFHKQEFKFIVGKSFWEMWANLLVLPREYYQNINPILFSVFASKKSLDVRDKVVNSVSFFALIFTED